MLHIFLSNTCSSKIGVFLDKPQFCSHSHKYIQKFYLEGLQYRRWTRNVSNIFVITELLSFRRNHFCTLNRNIRVLTYHIIITVIIRAAVLVGAAILVSVPSINPASSPNSCCFPRSICTTPPRSKPSSLPSLVLTLAPLIAPCPPLALIPDPTVSSGCIFQLSTY